jgi:hypothetical protein
VDFRDDVKFADSKPVVGFVSDELVFYLVEGANISKTDASEFIV